MILNQHVSKQQSFAKMHKILMKGHDKLPAKLKTRFDLWLISNPEPSFCDYDYWSDVHAELLSLSNLVERDPDAAHLGDDKEKKD